MKANATLIFLTRTLKRPTVVAKLASNSKIMNGTKIRNKGRDRSKTTSSRRMRRPDKRSTLDDRCRNDKITMLFRTRCTGTYRNGTGVRSTRNKCTRRRSGKSIFTNVLKIATVDDNRMMTLNKMGRRRSYARRTTTSLTIIRNSTPTVSNGIKITRVRSKRLRLRSTSSHGRSRNYSRGPNRRFLYFYRSIGTRRISSVRRDRRHGTSGSPYPVKIRHQSSITRMDNDKYARRKRQRTLNGVRMDRGTKYPQAKRVTRRKMITTTRARNKESRGREGSRSGSRRSYRRVHRPYKMADRFSNESSRDSSTYASSLTSDRYVRLNPARNA